MAFAGFLKHAFRLLSSRLSSRPSERAEPRRVRARYDAAVTSPENRRHWANADLLSADAANSPEVRRILRARARYEIANNCFARGITNTLANFIVGTGPRLQLLTPDAELNSAIERQFNAWAEAVNLAEKLRVMRMAVTQDGEAFAILTSNPGIDHPVQLDIRLVEADQIATPGLVTPTDRAVDGIVFDRWGNPVEYHLLTRHPGDPGLPVMDYRRISARDVIHYFHLQRPGQHRAIPEITPALPLFSQLRRYTLAVLAAAETAADFAAVVQTDMPPPPDYEAVAQPFEVVELEPRMATVLPYGFKIGQVQPQQPSTNHEAFVKLILNEIARCFDMPLNIALCNSAGYNYASGRLDHQTFFKRIRTEREHMARVVLRPILRAWLEEAQLIAPPLLPARGIAWSDLAFQFFWDGMEHVDPVKEATAQKIRLETMTTTLAYECAREGRDWEAVLKQRAKELALMRELGIADTTEAPLSPIPVEDTEDARAEA